MACENWPLEQKESGFPVTIIRPSHTYSKHWIPNPVSSSSYTFTARLEQGRPVFVPEDGQIPWTLTAVSDFAVGLAGLVGKRESLGEAFHITGDEAQTWNQIYNEIASALGIASHRIVPIPVDCIRQIAPSLTGTLKGDKAHYGIFDNTKIKRLVPEFLCRKPFRKGVRESVDWLRAHPENYNLNPKVDEICTQVIDAWHRSKT